MRSDRRNFSMKCLGKNLFIPYGIKTGNTYKPYKIDRILFLKYVKQGERKKPKFGHWIKLKSVIKSPKLKTLIHVANRVLLARFKVSCFPEKSSIINLHINGYLRAFFIHFLVTPFMFALEYPYTS